MSKQQLDLAGFKKAREKVDDKAIDKFFNGETDLAGALGLDSEAIDKMRRQAVALYGAGKWDACVKLVLGVVALGSVHPADALLLAKCYTELGNRNAAEQCTAHYEQMMRAVEENKEKTS